MANTRQRIASQGGAAGMSLKLSIRSVRLSSIFTINTGVPVIE